MTAARMMTILVDVSMIGIRESEATRATTREEGARSAIQAEAPLANEVRFALQELGRRGQEKPRRKAGERELSTADDSECDDLPA